jgi:hypothetical protein
MKIASFQWLSLALLAAGTKRAEPAEEGGGRTETLKSPACKDGNFRILK